MNILLARLLFLLAFSLPLAIHSEEGLPLYYWQQQKFVNFGDFLSLKIVERIVNQPVSVFKRSPTNKKKKLLAVGSIISFAADHDVVWGTGVNGKLPNKKDYCFTQLDVRSVRGPMTRQFLKEHFGIESPPIYGDPALLFPYLFPEFKRKENPTFDFIIIPHYSELHFFPKDLYPNAIYPTDPWNEVIEKILDSHFVISSSLHGIVLAEAYGIPARMLRITKNEPLFKYIDYYSGTNRFDFKFANSVEEALQMGGEKPFQCDLVELYEAFPFDFWPNATFTYPNFN